MDLMSMCKPLSQFSGGRLIGLYGRGSTGKTTVSASFPNPVFVIFDDQGLNAIKRDYPDIPYIDATGYSAAQLLDILDAADKVPQEITLVLSTFSVWIENHPRLLLEEKKKAHMNQDLWGEHATRVNQVIARCAQLAKNGKRVILEFHERTSVIEGYENELVPEISVNASPNIQRYLTGMLNYAFHTAIRQYNNPDKPEETMTCYTLDINPLNPYYWIKGQGAADNTPATMVVYKGQAYAQLKQFYSEI